MPQPEIQRMATRQHAPGLGFRDAHVHTEHMHISLFLMSPGSETTATPAKAEDRLLVCAGLSLVLLNVVVI
jgi:hypothetical protein